MQLSAVTNYLLPIGQMLQNEETIYTSAEKGFCFILVQPGTKPNVLAGNKVSSCKLELLAQTVSVLHL